MPRSYSSNVYVQMLTQTIFTIISAFGNTHNWSHVPQLPALKSLCSRSIYILVHWPKRFVNWIHSWRSTISIIQVLHFQYFIPYLPKTCIGRVCLLFSYPTIFAIIKDSIISHYPPTFGSLVAPC